MNSKEFLRRAWLSDMHLEQIKQRIDELEQEKVKITKETSGMPGSPNRDIEGFTKTVNKIYDLNLLYVQQMETIADYRIQAAELIQTLTDPVQQMILEMRYLEFKQFKVIASQMGYTKRQVLRIHDNAINTLDMANDL